jgi:dynein light chain roadblock-type
VRIGEPCHANWFDQMEDPDQTLSRLSQKPGVRQILILDRETGNIVRSSGFLTPAATGAAPGSPQQASTNVNNEGRATSSEQSGPKSISTAEEYASLVWNYVRTSCDTVKAFDEDVRLQAVYIGLDN